MSPWPPRHFALLPHAGMCRALMTALNQPNVPIFEMYLCSTSRGTPEPIQTLLFNFSHMLIPSHIFSLHRIALVLTLPPHMLIYLSQRKQKTLILAGLP